MTTTATMMMMMMMMMAMAMIVTLQLIAPDLQSGFDWTKAEHQKSLLCLPQPPR